VEEEIDFLPSSIAFGSCQSNWMEHAISDKINADVFIYMGDNIYGDDATEYVSWFPSHWLWYRNMLYNKLSCRHTFQRLVSRTPYVLSIWDDHDYGADDEGNWNPIRYESQAKFLDFWRIPKHSKRRRGHGVYGSHRFNASGSSILVILPDLRFFSDRTGGSMLGTEQWLWLEDTLRNQASDLTIIASTTPFSMESDAIDNSPSVWQNFPQEKRRLESLLDPNRTIFISGDVHRGGIIRSSNGFLDITSSPMCLNGLGPDGTNRIQMEKSIPFMYVDNYGLLDLKMRTGYVRGIDGSVLEVPI